MVIAGTGEEIYEHIKTDLKSSLWESVSSGRPELAACDIASIINEGLMKRKRRTMPKNKYWLCALFGRCSRYIELMVITAAHTSFLSKSHSGTSKQQITMLETRTRDKSQHRSLLLMATFAIESNASSWRRLEASNPLGSSHGQTLNENI